MSMPLMPPCMRCKHKSLDGFMCKAYPKQIPEEIMYRQVDHRKPYKGDHGIQWELDTVAPHDEEDAPHVEQNSLFRGQKPGQTRP